MDEDFVGKGVFHHPDLCQALGKDEAEITRMTGRALSSYAYERIVLDLRCEDGQLMELLYLAVGSR